MSKYKEILNALKTISNPEKKEVLQRFFKTGKGEYAEGDLFLGVTVPNSRIIVKEYWQSTSWEDLEEMIQSPFHEMRLVAILILVEKFSKAKKNIDEQEKIVSFYLQKTAFINNWDLVDQSCYKILGKYCFEQKKEEILLNLSYSNDLWEKRIAVVGTLYFIKKMHFDLALAIIRNNLKHTHDLMHKANGWMLREIGNKNLAVLINFLDEFAIQLPRTTLRYAIEKLDETKRQYYLKLK